MWTLVVVQEVEWLVEDLLKRGEGGALVASRIGRGAVEEGDQVRIDVFFLRAFAVEVVEQAGVGGCSDRSGR